MSIACTQDHVAPDECPGCGGWLHAEYPPPPRGCAS